MTEQSTLTNAAIDAIAEAIILRMEKKIAALEAKIEDLRDHVETLSWKINDLVGE